MFAAAIAALALMLLATVWLTGVLAGLLGSGHPVVLSLTATAQLLARLPAHLGDSTLAWPAGERARLPGAGVLDAILALSLTLAGAIAAVALVLATRYLERGSPARAARWASRGDLAELQVRCAQPGRVTLGYDQRRLIAAERRASVLVVGPTQSGKTTGLVVPALLESGRTRALNLDQDRRRRRHICRTPRSRRRQGLRSDRVHRTVSALRVVTSRGRAHLGGRQAHRLAVARRWRQRCALLR